MGQIIKLANASLLYLCIFKQEER